MPVPSPARRPYRAAAPGASRLRARLRATRIDDNDLTAGALCLSQKRHEVRRRGDRVVSPDEDELAVQNLAVGRTPAFAEGGLDGHLGRGAADAALQLARAQPVPQPGAGHDHLHQAERAAVAVGQNRLRARLGDDRFPACGDLVDRLFPGDAPPLSAALGSDAAQRIHQAIGMVDVIEVRPHLGAQPAARDGVIRIAAEVDGLDRPRTSVMMPQVSGQSCGQAPRTRSSSIDAGASPGLETKNSLLSNPAISAASRASKSESAAALR